MNEVYGRSEIPVVNCESCKAPGHQNCHVTRTAQTDTIRMGLLPLTEGEVELGAKAEYKKDIRGNQLMKRTGSKVTRKVDAFGPAHADQARKLYQFKGTQSNQNDKSWTNFLNRSNNQFGRRILLTQNEQDPMSANIGPQLEEPLYHGNRVHYIDLKKKQVPHPLMLELNQPILKIVTITPRPNVKYERKAKISYNAKHSKTSEAELLEKDEPQNSGDKTKQKSLTIFQILGGISGCV